jgi:hypothetical protein
VLFYNIIDISPDTVSSVGTLLCEFINNVENITVVPLVPSQTEEKLSDNLKDEIKKCVSYENVWRSFLIISLNNFYTNNKSNITYSVKEIVKTL